MNRLLKRIELIANVCIIVVALVIGVVLAKRFLFHTPAPESSVPAIQARTKIALPKVDWSRNGRTLLIVLSTGCRYCTASAPFYRRLLDEVALTQRTRLVAVFPQETGDGKKYLAGLNLPIDDVRQVSPISLGAKGTPTLILVDSSGVVIGSWVGQLPSDKEAEVFASLQ